MEQEEVYTVIQHTETSEPYSIVLLDMDGMFFDFYACERRAFINTGWEHGFQLSEGEYEEYQIINQQVWKKLEQGLVTADELKTVRFEEFFGRRDIHQLDFCHFAQRYQYWMSQGGDLYPGAEELWKRIRKKYRTCVLSNGTPWSQRSRLELSGLLPYTDCVVTSEEVGTPKPSARMFEYAMKQMGEMEKSRYVMLGDSISADIKGAVGFGVDSIWYNRTGEPDPGISTFSADTYEEIAEILGV